jgi:hypothetical protein
MVADGYANSSRLDQFKLYSNNQAKVNTRLKEIAVEIASLPKIPKSMEEWVGSWSDLTDRGFGMDTFSKHIKIKKEYIELADNADTNLREMKILAIEDLLDKINNTLNKSD